MRKVSLWISLAILISSISLVIPGTSSAVEPGCKDVLLLSLRGSGQTLESSREMERLSSQLAEGLKLISFDRKQIDYPALGLSDWFGFGPPKIEFRFPKLVIDWDNTLMSPYYESMSKGRDSLGQYLSSRAASCPRELYVVAGYSQGAHALGEKLSTLDRSIRDRIIFTALFGDPVATATRGPWSRGSAALPLGALAISGTNRNPYLPVDLESKSGLWCDVYDVICNAPEAFFRAVAKASLKPIAGAYASDETFKDMLTKAHSEYAEPEKEVDTAAREIIERLKRAVPAWKNQIRPKPATPTAEAKNIDIAFVIDTTASMGPYISDVKRRISDIVAALSLGQARVAVVEYKDYGDAYVSRVNTPFTTDPSVFKSAVDRLQASGGGDVPESVYTGLHTAFTLNWRPGAVKLAILIGDAPAHNPDKQGFTRERILAEAYALDPVVISPLQVGSSSATAADFGALAAGSGGTVYPISSATELSGSIIKLLENFRMAPYAALQGPWATEPNEPLRVKAGTPIQFSAIGSNDPDSAIETYEWDFTDDRKPDLIGPVPFAQFSFADGFSGFVSVTVRSYDGGTATANLRVIASNGTPMPTPPSAPQSLTAKAKFRTVSISWTPPQASSNALTGYIVFDKENHIVAVTKGTSLVVQTPTLDDWAFSVSAFNDAGYSIPATVSIKARGVASKIKGWPSKQYLPFKTATYAITVSPGQKRSVTLQTRQCSVTVGVSSCEWKTLKTYRSGNVKTARFKVILPATKPSIEYRLRIAETTKYRGLITRSVQLGK